MSNPWLKFYTTDWRADPPLRTCSLAARGVWIDLICLMHEATPYGHLTINGVPPTEAQLAVLVGTSPEQLSECLGELASAGVFSRTRTGVLYSRKLVAMAKKSAIAQKNGKNGGNPSLGNKKGNPSSDNHQDNGRLKPQKPEAREVSRRRSSAGASEATDLFSEVLSAVGLKGGRLPTYWMPPAAEIHVNRWRELGLTDSEIIEGVRAHRANYSDPPNGPKALDQPMQRLAVAKHAPIPDLTQTTTAATGGRNDRSRFDRTINELADRLSDGTVQLDHSSRDPWKAESR